VAPRTMGPRLSQPKVRWPPRPPRGILSSMDRSARAHGGAGPHGWGGLRPVAPTDDPEGPRLLERLDDALHARHYSQRTAKVYRVWVKRFVYFHGLRHPTEMGEPEINAFLTHLAVADKVSASTQNQALSALLFLYRHVLDREVGELGDVIRARHSRRLPVVFTREEARAVLDRLNGDKWLIVSLLYGSGLRLMECLNLRVKDLEFSRGEVTVREGKGGRDRVTMLPSALVDPLGDHLREVKRTHGGDVAAGWAESCCRMPLNASTRTRRLSGGGSGSFPRSVAGRTGRPGRRADTTFTRRWCSAPFDRPSAKRASPNTKAVTRSATRSPLTCWSRATTSELSKNCWATRTCALRWSTRTF